MLFKTTVISKWFNESTSSTNMTFTFVKSAYASNFSLFQQTFARNGIKINISAKIKENSFLK